MKVKEKFKEWLRVRGDVKLLVKLQEELNGDRRFLGRKDKCAPDSAIYWTDQAAKRLNAIVDEIESGNSIYTAAHLNELHAERLAEFKIENKKCDDLRRKCDTLRDSIYGI